MMVMLGQVTRAVTGKSEGNSRIHDHGRHRSSLRDCLHTTEDFSLLALPYYRTQRPAFIFFLLILLSNLPRGIFMSFLT